MRIVILMMILTIAGCGNKEPGSKTGTKTPPEKINLASQFFAGPLTPEAKFLEVKQSAESGNVKDQVGLARRYYNGDGTTKDYAKAAEWYQKAAEQGDDFAQYKLGAMYEMGEGVPKDAAKAIEWWQKAAAQGDQEAKDSIKRLSANAQ